MSEYEVLDLFAGLGGFSQAFVDSERWGVTTVEIEAEFEPDIVADVFELRPSDFDTDFDVVLASPPCKYFSAARNITEGGDPAWGHGDPASDSARDAVALVYHTLGLINGLAPHYWFLENPGTGRLSTTIGPPEGRVTYCQYGQSHQKPTDLWGEHPPMSYLRCSPGDDCHERTGGYEPDRQQPRLGTLSETDDPAERAKVPYGLSEAIRDACEAGLDGEAPVQTTLVDEVEA